MPFRSKLLTRGYLSLLVTQFFGAANDNLLKGVLTFMVVKGVWEGGLGEGGQGVVGLCFTLPFILLSGYAGQFADRNSKRFVSVLVKVVEIPIALLGLVGFWIGDVWITLLAMLALASQSAYFGPAKYGMIPELVETRDLSRANGVINMMTNIAVIAGTVLAGVVSDVYFPKAMPGDEIVREPTLWLPGAVMVGIAAAGLIAVLFLPNLPPGDRSLQYDLNPIGAYVTALKEMSRTPLLMVALAWGYFYFLAGLALLIIPEYTIVLQAQYVTDFEASQLLAAIGLSIGLGSAAAGLISGHHIEPRLVPIGAIGLSLFMFLLGVVPPVVSSDAADVLRMMKSKIALFILGAGFCAGFYIIPLQALLQKLSPADERGRFLGTANAISFSFLALSSLVYIIIRPAFGDQPQRIFLVSAALMIAGVAFFAFHLRHVLTRHGRAQTSAAD